MQKDFHYDIVYALAKEAGYEDEEAYVIAYSSQYVDDNIDREYSAYDSHGEFYVDFPEKIGKTGNLYFPIITQAADITSLEISIQRSVFAPFHFIPGDNTVEIKGIKNPLCTTKGCPNAVSLVQDSIKNADLYRMGGPFILMQIPGRMNDSAPSAKTGIRCTSRLCKISRRTSDMLKFLISRMKFRLYGKTGDSGKK